MKSGPNLSKACLSRMLDLGEFFLNFLEKTGKKINSLRLYRKKMKNIKKILLSGFTSLVLKKRNPVVLCYGVHILRFIVIIYVHDDHRNGYDGSSRGISIMHRHLK